ncbi:coiled-coil domain-containing protein 97-like isoform X2 [Watersipora subatra]
MSDCSCPDYPFVQAMLSYLAQTNSYFGGTQRGSTGLTQTEKENYLHKTLHQSKSTFITRYGSRLTPAHIDYFLKHFAGDEGLMYQMNQAEREKTEARQRVKNRRFTAMKEMMTKGDYFEDEQMKQRDPLYYEQMVGKYLTDEEIQAQSDGLLRQHTGFSTILLEHMDSKDAEEKYLRQVSREEEQLEESEEEEETEAEEEDPMSAEDRTALREEFLHTMQERFLSGLDKDFDYESIDNDERYDDTIQEGRDAEERYFDASDESVTEEKEPSQLAADEYDY